MCPKTIVTTCHVSFLAAPDTDHKHKYLTNLSGYLTNTHKIFGTRSIFTLRSSTAEWQNQHKSHLVLVMSPKRSRPKRSSPKTSSPEELSLTGILGQIRIKCKKDLRNSYQNPVAEDMDEIGKVGAEMSYIQSQMHSDYDSAESTADSDVEDGGLRTLMASPLYIQGRGGCKSSRLPTALVKTAAMIQERASAKRTQADHSRRASLMSSSSQEPRAYGKPDATFSSGSKEPGNQFESSIFKNADPSNLG